MKKIIRYLALMLAVVMTLQPVTAAFADEVDADSFSVAENTTETAESAEIETEENQLQITAAEPEQEPFEQTQEIGYSQ